ncbi:hypothetical protein [Legionella drancourtii]|uniref:Uncharacterized protein n=1 Tax=Legionella drancourtii LLAP12 TaxID=658187 RepID=G9ESE2_9GAMM|nr:hypothetical protein [Legionella drancourtii]EHL29923.1 hypothetical protein LDG_8216 [Legionella drancourtii LLAP12]
MSEFKDKPELDAAYQAAATLYAALKKAGNSYFANEPNPKSFEDFKLTCTREINTAREVLDNHRDWTKILVNILAIVLTGGVGYAIAAGINMTMNKGKFTFFSTDSSLKIKEIEESIKQAAPAA